MQKYNYASLNAEKLAKIKSFEEDLGSLILAVEPAVQLADLQADQLSRLQALEMELGVVLLAYKPPK